MESSHRCGAARAVALIAALLLQTFIASAVLAQGAPSQVKVFKYINGAGSPAGLVFSMTMQCNSPAYSRTFTVASEGFFELTDLPWPNTCTLTESPKLPPPPQGFAWNASNTPPPPRIILVPNGNELVISVFNSLIALGGGTGSLSISKSVAGGSLPGGRYNVTVACSNPVFNSTVEVSVESGVNISNIPAPNTCTISESAQLPAPPPGFVWDASNTPPAPSSVAIAVGASTPVVLTNTLRGVPPSPPSQPVPVLHPLALGALALLTGLGAGRRLRRRD